MSNYTLEFSEMTLADVSSVGGKNASLGELITTLSSKNIRVPSGFALTAEAFREFLRHNKLEDRLKSVLDELDKEELSNLHEVGEKCRGLIARGRMPEEITSAVLESYSNLSGSEKDLPVAVRSSATAEDLPTASFAGQHDSFLNIRGDEQLLKAVHRCYISLFNDRAIKYREDNGFEHMDVFLSVGVQRMVRSDKASAGVAFTIEPESGNRNLIYVTGAWGLGEAVVQGAVEPDEFLCFKNAIAGNKIGLIKKRRGAKNHMMVFNNDSESDEVLKTVDTPGNKQQQYCLSDEDISTLSAWCYEIEQHYEKAMDIEWAKDGISGELFILQARPETVHRGDKTPTIKEYEVKTNAQPICRGKAVGRSVVSGTARLIKSLADADKVQKGDVIVADITNPDWNSLLRKAVSIVTNKGGRTSHASIVARELGIPAVVGTGNATDQLKDGQVITVSCAQGDTGYIYDGEVETEVREWSPDKIKDTRTKPMLILADPGKAPSLAMLPNDGVGLMRMEFAITNSIQAHPMALIRFEELTNDAAKERIEELTKHYDNKEHYFIDELAASIATVAASFYPKDVIVRMSDFKTNEYARLVGGKQFEPDEENPMIGFRGASRYYNDRYKPAFGLECKAVKKAREEMGLDNVKVMIPFCRTVEEGRKVLAVMEEYGLERGEAGLEVYVMAEIPSNVILAEEFAEVFDGFSIGSNDLTQLTLGLDRDSNIVNDLFDENNEAVKRSLAEVISKAKKSGRKIGLCGQAPSDFPDFSRFLVEQGIDSISFNPDALLTGIENISKAEEDLQALTEG